MIEALTSPRPILSDLKQNKWLRAFTALTRVLPALGFTPPGLVKVIYALFRYLMFPVRA